MEAKLILEIGDDLRARIEARARANQRSVEEEAVAMIWAPLHPLPDDPSLPTGERIVRAFSGSGIWVDDQFQERIDAMREKTAWRIPALLVDEKDSAA